MVDRTPTSPQVIERFDCGECGQLVAVTERHTYVDCSLYAVEHGNPSARYAMALAREVRELRAKLERQRSKPHYTP